MKRLLKTTLKNLFSRQTARPDSAALIPHQPLWTGISLTMSAMTAATLGILGCPRPAAAFSLFQVNTATFTGTPASPDGTITVNGTAGGSAQIRFDFTDANNRLTRLQPAAAGTLNGGFPDGQTLDIQFDPANETDSIDLNIDFLTSGGATAEVERVRLFVIDIDRDNSNTWQDRIVLGGDGTLTVTPATTASPALGISPETPVTIPTAVDSAGGPGLVTAANYTVNTAGTTFVGVYAPITLQNANGVSPTGTTTELTPGIDAGVPRRGNVAINPITPLPNPAAPPGSAGVEAQNQSPEGTITADYQATAGQGISQVTLSYQNGPASPTIGVNPAGDTGYINNTDAGGTDNGGPTNHGIGLYTVFFTPGVIGTSKTVSTPVAVAGQPGQFDVTYTIRVQNFGTRTTLTNVQVTDDLTATYGGATGFSVQSIAVGGGGGQDLPVNAGFNGNGNQNLLVGTGSLAPGQFSLIQYTVRLDTADPNINPGQTYNNTAEAAADTPIGLRITDQSNNGTAVDATGADPNSDGDPLENTPTPVILPAVATTPAIGVSEQVISTTLNPTTGPTATYPGNTARVLYRIQVQNIGSERLTGVSLQNDFTNTFDLDDNGYEIVAVREVGGGPNNVSNPNNPAYDGGDPSGENANIANTNNAQLVTTGTLTPGQTSTYEIEVDVDLTGNGASLVTPLPGPFNNSTLAIGTGADLTTPSGLEVRDLSNDFNSVSPLPANLNGAINPTGGSAVGGSSVAPNNTTSAPAPDPADTENTPTPVSLAAQPAIGVSERVISSVSEPTGAFTTNTQRVVYQIAVQNIGPETLNNVQLVNSLEDTFGAGSFQLVGTPQFVSGVAALNNINNAYLGTNGGDRNLLGAGVTLAPSESGILQITVDVNRASPTLPVPLPGPYNNSTLATGTGNTSNLNVADRSNDFNSVVPAPALLVGAINPNNDTTAGGTIGAAVGAAAPEPGIVNAENVPTPVTFTIQPAIGVSERVLSSVVTPAGTYGANTVRVTYQIQVQNIGPENLNNVVLNNDFSPTFGPDGSFEIISSTEVGGGPNNTANAVNAAYDGGDPVDNGGGPANTNNSQLIVGGTLNVAQTSTYQVVVDIDTSNNGANLIRPLPGPYDNSTVATGTGVISNINVADISNDFNSVTPVPATLNGAINPNNDTTAGGTVGAGAGAPVTPPGADQPGTANSENILTRVSIRTSPEISVVERIDSTRTQIAPVGGTFGPNTARLVYQILVRNIGPEDLQNVVLNNDFRPTFGVSGNGPTDDFFVFGAPVLVTPPATGNLPVNAAFDGSGDLRLAGDSTVVGNTLPVGEFALYEITVDVNTAGNTVQPRLPGPFNNQTTTSGIGVNSTLTTTDVSNDFNPFAANAADPNNNAEANEDSENIVTPAIIGADVRVVKRITRVNRGGAELFVPAINQFNDQAGDTNDNLLRNLTAGSTQVIPAGLVQPPTNLQTGDVVEYTVYFFNAGTSAANNIELCDELRVPNILNSNSLQLALPNAFPNLAAFTTSGQLSARSPLSPLAASCADVSGTGNFPPGPLDQSIAGAGGGVVLGGPGSGLTVAPNQVGAFRFTVDVQQDNP